MAAPERWERCAGTCGARVTREKQRARGGLRVDRGDGYCNRCGDARDRAALDAARDAALDAAAERAVRAAMARRVPEAERAQVAAMLGIGP